AEGGALFTFVQAGSVVQQEGSLSAGGGIDDEFDIGLAPPATSPTLSIANSAVSGNVALGVGPSASGSGGGLATGQVTARVTNSTVGGNQTIGAPSGGFFIGGNGREHSLGGGSASGGGINSNFGSLTISGSTVNSNQAQGGPGVANFRIDFGGSAIGGGV